MLNVEISYRGDCTYAILNETEKALYKVHNETQYTAYVKDSVRVSNDLQFFQKIQNLFHEFSIVSDG